MKSASEIQKQLNHLVATIPSCNFIAPEDKKDIVGNSMLQILQKYNEGRLVDDYEKTKGYCFMILRNYCLQHKQKNKMVYSDSSFEHIEDENRKEYVEYNDHLKKLVKGQYSNHKMTPADIELCEFVLNDYNNEELAEIYGLDLIKMGRKKKGLSLRLKYLFNKPSRYFIMDINNSYYKIGCLTIQDIKSYFPTENLRNVKEKIYNGSQFKDGRYIITNEQYEEQQKEYLKGKKFR